MALLISCNKAEHGLENVIDQYEEITRTNDQDHWPNLSEEFISHKVKQHKDLLGEIDKLTGELSKKEKIDVDMLRLLLEDKLFHLEFASHSFPLDSEGGFLTGMIYALSGTRVNDDTSFQKYVEKLQAIPAYFKQREETMRKGQAAGKSSPKLVVNNVIDGMSRLLEAPAKESYFMKPVLADQDKFEKVLALLETEIFPAYQNFKSFLESEYLENAPSEIGISKIQDGKAFYEQRVRFYTTDDISPKEVYDLGNREVKRIRAEMDEILQKLEYSGSYKDFLQFLRSDPQFYPKDGQALLDRAAWIISEMQGKMPKYFNKLPRMPLTVNPVPASLAPNYTAGRYSPGNEKNQKPGEYWVNTTKLNSRPLYSLPALSLHEGVPGHHLQIMLAQEMEGLAKFRNTYLSAFGEGWGLYAEFLGKEAGMYKTEYEDFGRLTYEMWRACRLVVDPGMHYFGWDRQRAFDFMSENTALSIHEVNTEIDRYIGWPGQAVSYKIGELKIRALRKKAEEELGDKFDIREFHGKILENGSIPLRTLERVVEDWINESQ